jgi:HrpA-like RNA helicase
MKERKSIFELKQPTSALLSHIFQAYPLPLSSQFVSRNRPQKFFNEQTPMEKPSLQFYEMKQNARLQRPDYHSLQKNRAKLPAFSHQEMVVHLVKHHNIVLISGETG